MRLVAQTAICPIRVECVVTLTLRERDLCRYIAGRGTEKLQHLGVFGAQDVPVFQRVGHGGAVHGGYIAVQKTGAIQLTQNRHHAAGAVHVFHVVVLRSRCDFRKIWHFARHAVDIFHGEIDTAFVRRRQQMQYRVGGAAHGDVETDCIFKRLESRDTARQHAVIVTFVMRFCQRDN